LSKQRRETMSIQKCKRKSNLNPSPYKIKNSNYSVKSLEPRGLLLL
jgi:hypothetical protein